MSMVYGVRLELPSVKHPPSSSLSSLSSLYKPPRSLNTETHLGPMSWRCVGEVLPLASVTCKERKRKMFCEKLGRPRCC